MNFKKHGSVILSLSLSHTQSLSVDESSSQSTSHSPPPPTSQKLKSLTFSVRYLGYRDVMESMLIPGQCVEVVHSCVGDLAAAASDWPSSADQVND